MCDFSKMNKFELRASDLLTKWLVMPNLYMSNPLDMRINNINDKLQVQLIRDIESRKRLLEKRAFAHAQAMFPIENLVLEPPQYGLGVIPKLISIDNTNHEATRIIEKCNIAILKLSVIQKLLCPDNTTVVLELLKNNNYYSTKLTDLKEMLGSKVSVEEILYS